MRVFIKDFAKIARPLTELLKQTTLFQWTEREQGAFDKIRHCLATAPALGIPQRHGKFLVTTDASDKAIAFACYQYQKDPLNPDKDILRAIMYFSKTLTEPQSRYDILNKEFLAFKTALKRLKSLLLYQQFEYRTDNQALVYLLNPKKPLSDGKLGRWQMYASNFTFTPIHSPGVSRVMATADALSRVDIPVDWTESPECIRLNQVDTCEETETNHDSDTCQEVYVEATIQLPTPQIEEDLSICDPVTEVTEQCNEGPSLVVHRDALNTMTASASQHGRLATSSVDSDPYSTAQGKECFYRGSFDEWPEDFMSQSTQTEVDYFVTEDEIGPRRKKFMGCDIIRPRNVDNYIDENTLSNDELLKLHNLDLETEGDVDRQLINLSRADALLADRELGLLQGDSAESQYMMDSDPSQTEVNISFDEAQFAEAQQADPDLGAKISYLRDETLPPDRKSARKILHGIDTFYLSNRLLYRTVYDKGMKLRLHQLCVPDNFIKQILMVYHDKLAHPSSHVLYDNLRARFYFKNMASLADHYAETCEQCIKSKPFRRQHRALLHPYEIDGLELFNTVHADILVIDNLKNSKSLRYRYCFIIVDHFSKYCRLIPCQNCTAKNLAQLFMQHWALDFSIPSRMSVGRLITDNGKYFLSSVFCQIATLMGYKQSFISYFRSSANGAAEIQCKLAQNLLRKLVAKQPSQWHMTVKHAEFQLNMLRKATLGNYCPLEIVTGHTPRNPIDNVLNLNDRPLIKNAFTANTVANMQVVHEIITRNLTKAQATMTTQYNKHACPQKVLVGDLVTRKIENLAVHPTYYKKLSYKYGGSYKVIKKLPNNTCILEDIDSGEVLSRPMALDKLKVLKVREAKFRHQLDQTPWLTHNKKGSRGMNNNEGSVSNKIGPEPLPDHEIDLEDEEQGSRNKNISTQHCTNDRENVFPKHWFHNDESSIVEADPERLPPPTSPENSNAEEMVSCDSQEDDELLEPSLEQTEDQEKPRYWLRSHDKR
jgi:hypothetical protein